MQRYNDFILSSEVASILMSQFYGVTIDKVCDVEQGGYGIGDCLYIGKRNDIYIIGMFDGWPEAPHSTASNIRQRIIKKIDFAKDYLRS